MCFHEGLGPEMWGRRKKFGDYSSLLKGGAHVPRGRVQRTTEKIKIDIKGGRANPWEGTDQ